MKNKAHHRFDKIVKSFVLNSVGIILTLNDFVLTHAVRMLIFIGSTNHSGQDILMNLMFLPIKIKFRQYSIPLFFVFTLLTSSIWAQTSQQLKPVSMVNTNAMLKARYIFNFTKYIEWSADLRKGNFIVGVIGNPDVFKEMIKVSETKQINNQPLEVKTFSSVESITYCHILFVSTDKNEIIQAILNKINGSTTLLITDKDGMLKQGSGINFIIRNNKLEFELNRPVIQKVGLSLGSGLALLAVTVL